MPGEMSPLGRELFNLAGNLALEAAGMPPEFPAPAPKYRQTFARAREETELILEQHPELGKLNP